MAVFRVEKNHNYTVMSNFHLRDTNLSLKAVGLLSKMLSLTDEWNYTTRGLAAICKEGVDAIGAALKELESCSYLVRNQLRDAKGRISDTEYTIYESPHMPLPDTALPDTDLPPILGPVSLLVLALKWVLFACFNYAEIGTIAWGAGGLPPRLLCGRTVL